MLEIDRRNPCAQFDVVKPPSPDHLHVHRRVQGAPPKNGFTHAEGVHRGFCLESLAQTQKAECENTVRLTTRTAHIFLDTLKKRREVEAGYAGLSSALCFLANLPWSMYQIEMTVTEAPASRSNGMVGRWMGASPGGSM